MKSITFAVPCYNSAAYMRRCVDSLLVARDEAEIILVDDGSTDDTGKIADEYAALYPDVVRAVHQPNGGHGAGVNKGLELAEGEYYKVVDSDDWLDEQALARVLSDIRDARQAGELADMIVCNYVYEHVEDGSRFVMAYRNVFPDGRTIPWSEAGRFGPSQFLVMHSVLYKTEILRACGLHLPEHTFYVDNIFIYQPLMYCHTVRYLNADLYRYFIGRPDQSVNERQMVKRMAQQLRVCNLVLSAYTCDQIRACEKPKARYMLSFVTIVYAITCIVLTLADTSESLALRKRLGRELRERDPKLYHAVRHRVAAVGTHLPGRLGRKTTIKLYHLLQRVYKFQ